MRADGDLKLIAYMMAGHPNRKRSLEVGKRLANSGIAALEIGIPHSDPLADGPVIQHAGQMALEHGMTVGASLELAAAIARELGPGGRILVCLSGRGDKDMDSVDEYGAVEN